MQSATEVQPHINKGTSSVNNIKVQELSYDPMFVQALEDFRLKRRLGLIKASNEGEVAKKQYGRMYYEMMNDDRKAEKSDSDDK